MSKSQINQQAIADKLSISRSTVTRVLRHDPVHRISPETRELILQTAREMGYQLRRRRTGNIAFVVCGEMASRQIELHMAVCDEAAKSDCRVFFVHLPEFPSYKQISLHVNPITADGAMLIGKYNPELAQKLAAVMPVVILDDDYKLTDVDQIIVDYVALGRLLTEELIRTGHQRIAVIAQFPEDVTWRGPLEGYRQAIEAAGGEASLSMVRPKSGRLYPELLNEILNISPKPTGILALTTSDHAIILSTLMAMGVDVPGDVSYVGWAYSYVSALLPFPAITCLDDIYQSMARAAVGRLFARAEDGAIPAETITVPVSIRSGETCIKR
ncbi:MAG: LacI family DNA-binding transcriptional regulator [Armatimonadota bacterium]